MGCNVVKRRRSASALVEHLTCRQSESRLFVRSLNSLSIKLESGCNVLERRKIASAAIVSYSSPLFNNS
uniref:Uncharacterized protein n=1 Tax=Trichogramma kaykai TaxID=54128 RepID=A0ABD2XRD3_9HYME